MYFFQLLLLIDSKAADELQKCHPKPHRLRVCLGLEAKNPGNNTNTHRLPFYPLFDSNSLFKMNYYSSIAIVTPSADLDVAVAEVTSVSGRLPI